MASALLALTLLTALPPPPGRAATLEEVRERSALRCGLNPNLPGFSQADSLGRFRGFDVDLCRAVAMAVLGDPSAVEPVPLTAGMRFEALRGGLVDLLSRNTGWTLGRDARVGEFAGVSFHDGQGFMVNARTGIRSALQLEGSSVCVARDSVSGQTMADYFDAHAMSYRPVFFAGPLAAIDGYAKGACTVLSGSLSVLAARRTTFEEPAAHRILPEILSKEPLGPMVRDDDERWEDIVRWSLFCLIEAEELGIDSASAAGEGSRPRTPAQRRLLGLEGEAAASLRIGSTWCADIVRQVGNYAEIYARHLGPDTPLGLARGINALWTEGGLIHSPPFR